MAEVDQVVYSLLRYETQTLLQRSPVGDSVLEIHSNMSEIS